jgi:hypothetical protein
MNKITSDHLGRQAYLYIRQSTPGQVKHNLESQRMQYAVAERARALGWQEVEIIDEDLGISASGTNRPALSVCCTRYAMARQVRSSASKRHRGWLAMAESGIRCWSSAA